MRLPGTAPNPSKDWNVRVYNIKEQRFSHEFTDTALAPRLALEAMSQAEVVCLVALPKPGALITANANAVLQPLGPTEIRWQLKASRICS